MRAVRVHDGVVGESNSEIDRRGSVGCSRIHGFEVGRTVRAARWFPAYGRPRWGPSISGAKNVGRGCRWQRINRQQYANRWLPFMKGNAFHQVQTTGNLGYDHFSLLFLNLKLVLAPK